MKIFKVTREDTGNYDENFGHIIVAFSKQEAIDVAKKCQRGDELESVWDTAEVLEVGRYTGKNENPHILLSDYHQG